MKLVLVQALRAFAALLVVVHHAQNEAAVLAGRAQVAFAPSTLLPWPAGVDVFFVISGFIIVHASRPLYGRPGGRRRFVAHRIARLVPLYWLVTAAYLALALALPGVLSGEGGGRLDPSYVAASFLFWPALRADGAPLPLYGLGWTLNCEMFFYALFALGLGWGRRLAVAWLVAALSLLALARAAIPALPMPLAFWTNPIVLEFALGAGLGLARAEGLRLGAAVRSALALAGLGLLALVPEPGMALRPLFYGIPAALLVAASALGRDEAARAGIAEPSAEPQAEPQAEPSFAVRCAAALGDASYALYLVHPFALRAVREAITRLGLAPLVGPWGGLAIMIGLAVLAALAVYRFIEYPLTRRARALLDPTSRQRAEEAAGEKGLDGAAAHVPRAAKRI